MTLYLIGIGLNDEKDITLKGLEIVKRSDKVYLENYTSILHCKVDDLEMVYGKKVHLADRDFVEKKGDVLVDEASRGDVAFLVIGDPISATTHLDLFLRAVKKGVKVDVVHNASVLTAVGVVGLQLYKYGRTASIVFPQEGWDVQTPYDVVKENKKAGLHTLCLLDIKTKEPSREELRKENAGRPERPQFMTVNQAIRALLDVEQKRGENVFTDETLCVGCARLGSKDMKIRAGRAKELLADDFGEPLHCLIVPGKLHFMEEEALELWKQ
ncbi:MAG: diphthine synthase [Nanoarchaeota archaeon]|nr:diphthine synthase [Nanoarchaeota archaeon]